MCGIVGRFSKESNSAQVAGALSKLRHRGPDDSGTLNIDFNDWNICLGQTRLSIIDLSPGGHQPFSSWDMNFSLVFNGEIYNYKEIRSYLIGSGVEFRTQSDTEVLLNAWIHWGVECLPKLKGMFAFVVFDKKNQSVTLARDAFGIKPLFYHQEGDSFAFASEIGALGSIVPTNLKLNNQKMFDYISFGKYDYGRDTFFDGIKNLEPGHTLTLDFSKSRMADTISRWWWPDTSENTNISEAQAIEEVRERFLENVRLHLISDVPLGAALSGGLDSSAIVCAMRHLDPNLEINTFSYIARESKKNEETWVDLVNKHIGAISHKVLISPKDLVRDLDDMILAQGEPFGSTSIYAQYRVYKMAKETGITVTLDGQGADELFAGYFGYPEWKIRSLIAKGNLPKALNFLSHWKDYPDRSASEAFKSFVSISFPNSLVPVAFQILKRRSVFSFISTEEVQKLALNDSYPMRRIHEITWNRALAGKLRESLTMGDLSRLLRHGDRNSMRWSVESRVPFLTTDFVEFILSLPEDYLISQKGVTKYIFKKAMTGIVPDQIINRRDKVGFETPEYRWIEFFKKDLDSWLESLSEIDWIDIDLAKTYFSRVFDGDENFSWVTWRLINAAKWYKMFLN
jgi:asparagine synthase (glutamine-hydrolysing)